MPHGHAHERQDHHHLRADTAPGLDWRKAGRTDLDPILKECVILAAAPNAKGHPHDSIPDGTRMVAISDDKNPQSPVLLMSRVEMTKFFDGVIAGEFDEFRATQDELLDAGVGAI